MLGEHLGKGPLGLTMARMLERGNAGSADASTRLGQCLGLAPRSLLRALAEAPSHTQDRWHARLYLLLPLMRVMVALLWIGSGVVGWLLPLTDLIAAAPSASLYRACCWPWRASLPALTWFWACCACCAGAHRLSSH